MLDRRSFLFRSGTAAVGLAAGALSHRSHAQQPTAGDRPPALAPELVREFVNVGHGQLVAVRQMLQEHPTLLNACWDWGGGDFETAIEGASHVGSLDVVHHLLGQGARANIFTLAVLGRTAEVKALLAVNPAWLRARGAHGLTLLHHAERGDAQDLAAYLRSQGLTELRLPLG